MMPSTLSSDTSFEGLDTRRCQSPISGNHLTNVAITGQGCHRRKRRVLASFEEAEGYRCSVESRLLHVAVPSRASRLLVPIRRCSQGRQQRQHERACRTPASEEGSNEIKRFLRPVMMSLVSCKNVWLNGVIFQNSPAWNIHPLMCENVLIEDVLVRNPSYAQNGDGLDLECCKNALIVNSTFDVGDDGICIKSGKDADGRKRGIPCENVIVNGCTVFKGHGGFVVGSEMSGGVKNIKVSDCQFLGTDVGLRFKSTRGRGGVVENIYIDNMSMFDIQTDVITFDLYYGGKSAVEVLNDGDEAKSQKVDRSSR